MNNANLGDSYHVDKLDADAVCAQCSTVNAEGTLLCKVCGNNLRDQRNRRLMADQAMDLEHTGRRRKSWLSAILFFLAIILIVSTLLNQEVIVDWMIDVQSMQEASVDDLWDDDFEATFEPMLTELRARDLTEESARAALEGASASAATDGIYALFVDEQYAGVAYARTEGEYLYVAALLPDGAEVRGIAQAQANRFISVPTSAGIMTDRGRVREIQGVVMPQGNGLAECVGDDKQTRINLLAYRLPDP